MNGKDVVGKLQDDLTSLLDDTDWNPNDVSPNTSTNFIEVKSMLVYAKRKLTNIAKNEGYIKSK